MAWDINRVVLVGRLSNDVELRHTNSGVPVARFGIAVGGRPTGNGQDSVSFFTVVVWNKAAETAAQYLNKGKQVAVDGRLEQRSWTAQDGTRRSVVEIVAERVEFLSSGNSQNNQGGGYQQRQPQQNNQQQQRAPQNQSRENDYYDNTSYDGGSFDDGQINSYDDVYSDNVSDDDTPF